MYRIDLINNWFLQEGHDYVLRKNILYVEAHRELCLLFAMNCEDNYYEIESILWELGTRIPGSAFSIENALENLMRLSLPEGFEYSLTEERILISPYDDSILTFKVTIQIKDTFDDLGPNTFNRDYLSAISSNKTIAHLRALVTFFDTEKRKNI